MALMTFQRAYGLFPRLLGKGDAAQVSQSAFQVGPVTDMF